MQDHPSTLDYLAEARRCMELVLDKHHEEHGPCHEGSCEGLHDVMRMITWASDSLGVPLDTLILRTDHPRYTWGEAA